MQDSELNALFAQHDIMPTPQRLEIARILLGAPQHLSAEQVMQRMHDAGSTVSKATVYNTLGLFAEKGLVRQVIVDPTRVFYDSTTVPHFHFYHVDTGSLEDIEPDLLPLSRLPRAPDGTEVCGVDVIVRVQRRS